MIMLMSSKICVPTSTFFGGTDLFWEVPEAFDINFFRWWLEAGADPDASNMHETQMAEDL